MKNIITRSFLFAAAETTTTAAGPVVEAPAKKQPTQFTVNTTEKDKATIAEIVEEFSLKNTMEAVSLLLTVAGGNRFYKVQATEIPEGETEEVPVFDTDGQPVMLTCDRWEDAAKEIEANRASVKAAAQLEKLKAKMAELEASQARYKSRLGL